MLRITQQNSPAGAKAYYSRADYLSEGQELVGLWRGQGARLLGLEGVVQQESFERLCDNLHPTEPRQLTVRTRSERTVGYDFTFSVPKSVSLLYALTNDQQFVAAFRSAVDETMRDIESEMKTRVRRGGRDEERTTGNMVWAEFVHTTSRPVDGVPDPQLHAHCFAFNSVWDKEERRWKAGQFRELKRDAPFFQAAFRVRLANKLQDLGFAVERKRDDFEFAGFSTGLLKRFSRRTEEIERVAAEKGITDPKRKAELGKETREKKAKNLTWSELQATWDERLSQDERKTLIGVYRSGVRPEQSANGAVAAVDYAIEHCFEREAVVPERKLLTEALKRGLIDVTVEDVRRELDRRPLIRGDVDGRRMVTTREMKSAEAAVIAFARDGRGRYRPLGDPERRCSREWLNEGQKAAVRHVLGSRDSVAIVRGVFGTGKTTLEQEIGEGLAAAGLQVVALAPTAAASDVLRDEAKFEKADTVARFLVDKRMQESVRWGVVLVDEAGMLSTRDMRRLFEVAESVKCRVVLVGDRKQTRAVGAGQPLQLLEERAGLPVAKVTEILRQGGEYKRAAKALSEGRIGDALAILDDLKWVKEVPGEQRYDMLAESYLAAIQERKRNGECKSALAVSATWAEAAKITAAVRAALEAAGKLGEERELETWVPAHLTAAQKADGGNFIEVGDLLAFHQNAPRYRNGVRVVLGEGQEPPPAACAARFEVYRPSRLKIAVGDRVRVTRNGVTADGRHKLRNGAILTVDGFTSKGELVVDHGWVIPKEWGHISLGYAVSAESSQGRTVDKVFVSLSTESFPAVNQRRFSVPTTRGKEQVLVFTDDREGLLKAAQRPDEPLSATEFAESQQRKRPLRQRLKKHLSFLRRTISVATTPKLWIGERERPQLTSPEVRYGR
jgi:conjugative relaxase-like TrwC/TraI family protein